MPNPATMPGSPIGYAFGLLFATFFLLRQLRPQPIRLRGTAISSVMFVVLFLWVSTAPHLRSGDALNALVAAVPADVLGALAGALLGFYFGTAVEVRYDPRRGPVRQASVRLVGLWLALLAVRFGLGLTGRTLNLSGAEQFADGLLALAFASIIARNIVLLGRARRLDVAEMAS